MNGISNYIIKAHPDFDKIGVFDVESAGNMHLNVTGEVVSAPRGVRGNQGDDIWYQYNSLIEAPSIFSLYLVEPDVVYKVGKWMVNGWVFGDLKWERDDVRCLSIMSVPMNSFYEQGMVVLVPRKLSHRVLPKTFTDKSPYAFYQRHIIGYL